MEIIKIGKRVLHTCTCYFDNVHVIFLDKWYYSDRKMLLSNKYKYNFFLESQRHYDEVYLSKNIGKGNIFKYQNVYKTVVF